MPWMYEPVHTVDCRCRCCRHRVAPRPRARSHPPHHAREATPTLARPCARPRVALQAVANPPPPLPAGRTVIPAHPIRPVSPGPADWPVRLERMIPQPARSERTASVRLPILPAPPVRPVHAQPVRPVHPGQTFTPNVCHPRAFPNRLRPPPPL
jgi:hypothetical protein